MERIHADGEGQTWKLPAKFFNTFKRWPSPAQNYFPEGRKRTDGNFQFAVWCFVVSTTSQVIFTYEATRGNYQKISLSLYDNSHNVTREGVLCDIPKKTTKNTQRPAECTGTWWNWGCCKKNDVFWFTFWFIASFLLLIFLRGRGTKNIFCATPVKRGHITSPGTWYYTVCSGQAITAKVQETTARFGVRSQAQALDLLYGCTPFYHLSRRGNGVGAHNSENSGNNGKGNENLAAAIPRGGSSCPLLPGRIWIFFFLFFACLLVCFFLRREENQKTRRNLNPLSKDENQQQTQPTCDTQESNPGRSAPSLLLLYHQWYFVNLYPFTFLHIQYLHLKANLSLTKEWNASIFKSLS